MNLQTGFDCSQAGISQFENLNGVNGEQIVPAYFELSTGIDGCMVLDNSGNYIDNERYQVMQAIVSNTYPNLRIGFYHALYDPNYNSNAMSCHEQGVVFGMSLVNNYIPSTNLMLVLDIEEFSFAGQTVSISEVENCINEFMSGLESQITGNYSVMIYSNPDTINNISNPPLNTSSTITAGYLWLANPMPAGDYSFYEPNNSQIENGMLNAISWSGGVCGWQYAQSNIVDLDIFDLDVIYDSNMNYNPVN